ncbi:homeobox-leucine zipper protein HDG11-like [Prosopis cineraria]|uniref:homeobox-leucine zipper protein HDG11-like n=1 Tax=Prosopis cineraria TaxID=364024 RepID=UPI00240F7579|nr:homeobox-leucine zipper protein HDG11-like [Prosopis cineraria]
MDLSLSVGSGSGDEQNTASSQQTGRKSAHRHTPLQIQRLEEFFKECPHPDEEQRKDLGKELGLEPKQIKFWFQNKRTQTKTQNERIDNNVLRAENERIQNENCAIKEVLKGVNCPACGGPANNGDEEHMLNIQKLLQENAYLKQEHEKATRLLGDYVGKPMIIQKDFLTLGTPSSSSSEQAAMSMSMSDDNSNMLPPKQGTINSKAVMWETAVSSMEELVRLLRVNEPLWIRSEASEDVDDNNEGFFLPNRSSYERIFPRAHHFGKKLNNARVECSKASRVVNMGPMQLVDMFLDADKWVNLFPTIVGKAHTVEVLEAGLPGSRNGALQLMYEELHMLTPMVPPREFVFLRYCYQTDKETWVIGDVSFDSLEDIGATYSASCWKLPSGCMIQELPTGFSKVTWVEHVEVEHQSLIVHMLYRNLVFSSVAYGAQRWVVALQRICERIAYTINPHIPPLDEAPLGASSAEGRRSLMKLGHRMIRSFCGVISMTGSGREDFTEISEDNEIGIRAFIRKNLDRGQPQGMTLTAAAPIWLPFPPNRVFHFLRDVSRRYQWDVLCHENTEKEIVRISTGTHPGNYISIIQTYHESDSVAILQETCMEPMGYALVYAPVDKLTMNGVMNGEDSATVSILPSGFVVVKDGSGGGRGECGGGSSSGGEGSVLTMTLQILVSNSVTMRNMNMESVATVNNLVTATLNKIKFALMSID